MKIKTLEQMTKEELVALCRAKDVLVENAQARNQQLAKDLWTAQELAQSIEKELKRERIERNNYFEAFHDILVIAKNISERIS